MANPSHVLPVPAGAMPSERSYLTEHTFGTIWGAIARIYRTHLLTISLCGLLPMLPVIALLAYAIAFHESFVLWLYGAGFIVGIVVNGAYTALLSDICLGNRPTVARSFASVFGGWRWLSLLTTAILFMLAVWFGMLLLVVPGCIVMARGVLCSSVVALEGRRNLEAIKRSFALTKGQAWRIFGLLLPPYLLLMVSSVLGGFFIGGTAGWELFWKFFILNAVVNGLFAPTFSITIVLLYYDQRVRREGYDTQRLAQDLMR